MAFWAAAALAMLATKAWGGQENCGAQRPAELRIADCGIQSSILNPQSSILWAVTAYCPCKRCCGPAARGVTASGRPAQGWLVAGPPELALGSRVIVPGYAGGLPVPVLDRGGSIKGRRLDVLFPTHDQARAWGVRTLAVEVLR